MTAKNIVFFISRGLFDIYATFDTTLNPYMHMRMHDKHQFAVMGENYYHCIIGPVQYDKDVTNCFNGKNNGEQGDDSYDDTRDNTSTHAFLARFFSSRIDRDEVHLGMVRKQGLPTVETRMFLVHLRPQVQQASLATQVKQQVARKMPLRPHLKVVAPLSAL